MRLLVGRIGRAHGILGEATIEVRSDDPERRFAVGQVIQSDEHGSLIITSARVHNGTLLLGFAGYSDRNQIEKLRNSLLYADVDINEVREDAEDYHVLALIGCTAFLESGEIYGEISDVINLPGQDLLVIKTPTHEALIPFVHQLVPIVDVKAKRVVVMPPDMKEDIK